MSIKKLVKVYRDPNGVKVMIYDPIGDEVAYNTVRAMIKFNEDIDSSTINASNFYMENEDGSSFPITVAYEQDPFALNENAVFLNFQAPIVKGKHYPVTMTDGIKGISGKYVQYAIVWIFKVGAFSSKYDAEDGLFDSSRFGY